MSSIPIPAVAVGALGFIIAVGSIMGLMLSREGAQNNCAHAFLLDFLRGAAMRKTHGGKTSRYLQEG